MAGANTLSTLNGLFKEVYADAIRDLVPSAVKLQKEIRFVAKAKELGNQYHQPVVLAQEHGFTFANPGSTGDAFTLNSAVAGQIKDAVISANEIVLRSRLSYAAASRAAQGRNAFIDATEQVVRNMKTSMTKKLEVELFYGSSGIGKVASVSDANDTITIDAAEWAPGIWTGGEGMLVEVYGGSTLNTTAGVLKVTHVDIATRTLTVVGYNPSTGGTSAADLSTVSATNDLYFYKSYGNEMKGLHAVLNTSGTLFGIDNTVYSLFKGSNYAVGGSSLSFNHISGAIDQAVARGLDEDAVVFISTKAFSDILIDIAAKRMYDSSYNTNRATYGNNEIIFYSQNGAIKLVPSIYVKEGYAYVTVPTDWLRIGSTDVTFNRPGQQDTFFMDLQDAAGYELRAYTDQALLTEAPGRQVIISGIVNSYSS